MPIRSSLFVKVIGVPMAALLAVTGFGVLGEGQQRQTHAMPNDFPQSHLVSDAPSGNVYRIVVAKDGHASLNGERLNPAQLTGKLRSLATAVLHPAIASEPEPNAAYGDAVLALKAIWDAKLTSERFCLAGLGQHAEYDDTIEPLNLSI